MNKNRGGDVQDIVRLNTDVERAEWLRCLQAAVILDIGRGYSDWSKRSANAADELFLEYRKRCV
jgi:hypothetical protein